MEFLKKALIIGANGQDGSYLSHHLLSLGYEVVGVGRSSLRDEILGVHDSFNYIKIDIRNHDAIELLLSEVKFDEIYNLASLSSVRACSENPELSYETNQLFVEVLARAIKTSNINVSAKLLQCSSSEMFGSSNNKILDESTTFNASSVYGKHKLAAHQFLIREREKGYLHVSTNILFNHESPLRSENFVSRKITKSAYLISKGSQKELSLGDVSIMRDWGYAGDFVRAMQLTNSKSVPDDFVIATGELHSIREIVNAAFEYFSIDNVENYLTRDPDLVRKVEFSAMKGNNDKAIRILGWKPQVSFEELIFIMCESETKS